MRSDPDQSDEFSSHSNWGNIEFALFRPADENGDGEPSFLSTAFSGNERNRLFMRQGESFVDASLVSGIDFTEDARGFALFDYDSDGFVDIALVSPNQPRLRVIRNRLHDLGNRNSSLLIELVGGNTKSEPSTEWSARDAFGATVVVTAGGVVRRFQLSCGEGLSSQNEKRIRVGLGKTETAEKIEVFWPSGKRTTLVDVDLRGGRTSIRETLDATKP